MTGPAVGVCVTDEADLRLLAKLVSGYARACSGRDGAVPENVTRLRTVLEQQVAVLEMAKSLPGGARSERSEHGNGPIGTIGTPVLADVATLEGMRSVQEVAQQLGIGDRAVIGLIRRGTLLATHAGGRWLVTAEDLADLLERRGVA